MIPLDRAFHGGTGLDVLQTVRASNARPLIPIVMLREYPRSVLVDRASHLEVFLRKPVDVDFLQEQVEADAGHTWLGPGMGGPTRAP
jgi:CheY-like chemotaxis protein